MALPTQAELKAQIKAALEKGIPYVTTKRAANAVVQAMKRLAAGALDVLPLQEYHRQPRNRSVP